MRAKKDGCAQRTDAQRGQNPLVSQPVGQIALFKKGLSIVKLRRLVTNNLARILRPDHMTFSVGSYEKPIQYIAQWTTHFVLCMYKHTVRQYIQFQVWSTLVIRARLLDLKKVLNFKIGLNIPLDKTCVVLTYVVSLSGGEVGRGVLLNADQIEGDTPEL